MDSDHQPNLYYLVSWKSYLEEKNSCKPALAMIYFYKPINTFYHNYSEKSSVIFLLIDSALPMAKPIVKLRAEVLSKQKQNKPPKDGITSKHTKKTWSFSFLSCFWLCFHSKLKILLITWSGFTPLCFAVWFFNSSHFSIFIQFLVFPSKY